jgi:hypothetical protein
MPRPRAPRGDVPCCPKHYFESESPRCRRHPADLRGVGIGGGVNLFGGEPRSGVVAIPSRRVRAGRDRSLNASLDENRDQITPPVVENRGLRVFV